jgi:hypothetical protein
MQINWPATDPSPCRGIRSGLFQYASRPEVQPPYDPGAPTVFDPDHRMVPRREMGSQLINSFNQNRLLISHRSDSDAVARQGNDQLKKF